MSSSTLYIFLNCSKSKPKPKPKPKPNQNKVKQSKKTKKLNLHLQKLVQSTNDNSPPGWKITWCLPCFTLMKECLYKVCYIIFTCTKNVSHRENGSESNVLPAAYPERVTVILLYCTLR